MTAGQNDTSGSARTTQAESSALGASPFCLESPGTIGEVSSTHSSHVSKNDFEIVGLIGHGHSGTIVQLVKLRQTGSFYAMKTIDKWALIEKRNSGDVKAIDRANAERNLHVTLSSKSPESSSCIFDCPYFVKFYYSFQTPRNLYYILEYCGVDVLEYINQFGRLSSELTTYFLAELSVAVEALHKSGSIHRDIKIDNILISQTGHIRLSDFGSSKKVSESTRCDSIVGFSLSIMPPEFFGGEPSYGSAIDWFQVGICAFEVLTGTSPFHGRPLTRVNSPDYPPVWPSELQISSSLKDLIAGLLRPDESDRIDSLDKVRHHPSMVKVDWEAVKEGAGQAPFPLSLLDEEDGRPKLMPPFLSEESGSEIGGSMDGLAFDPLPFKSFSYIRHPSNY